MIDAMALVQRLKGDHKTFAEVAESLLCLVLHEGSNPKRIDVIFDVYKEKSIKNAERERGELNLEMNLETFTPEHKM